MTSDCIIKIIEDDHGDVGQEIKLSIVQENYVKDEQTTTLKQHWVNTASCSLWGIITRVLIII